MDSLVRSFVGLCPRWINLALFVVLSVSCGLPISGSEIDAKDELGRYRVEFSVEGTAPYADVGYVTPSREVIEEKEARLPWSITQMFPPRAEVGAIVTSWWRSVETFEIEISVIFDDGTRVIIERADGSGSLVNFEASTQLRD